MSNTADRAGRGGSEPLTDLDQNAPPPRRASVRAGQGGFDGEGVPAVIRLLMRLAYPMNTLAVTMDLSRRQGLSALDALPYCSLALLVGIWMQSLESK